MIHKELNTGRARLALFTARDVADQHPKGLQNARNWPIFSQIQSLTLLELEMELLSENTWQ